VLQYFSSSHGIPSGPTARPLRSLLVAAATSSVVIGELRLLLLGELLKIERKENEESKNKL
jgi:hypothetical protein